MYAYYICVRDSAFDMIIMYIYTSNNLGRRQLNELATACRVIRQHAQNATRDAADSIRWICAVTRCSMRRERRKTGGVTELLLSWYAASFSSSSTNSSTCDESS